jgi:hypothetical protein
MSTALLKPLAGCFGRFLFFLILRLVAPKHRGIPAVITRRPHLRRNHQDRRRHGDLPLSKDSHSRFTASVVGCADRLVPCSTD